MRCFLCKADISDIGDGTGYGVWLTRYCGSCWAFKARGEAFKARGESAQTAAKTDPVNRPSHYCVNGMECIDVIEGLGLGYRLGSAFAYIWRAGRKANAVEDLKKARWYLDREIANLEGKK